MLQSLKKDNRIRLLLFLLVFFVLSGCKEDGSTVSSEEQAYLADFEPSLYKWGVMDTTGTLVIKAQYDDLGPFREGLAAFNLGGRWGFLDRQGRIRIEAQYKSVWAFHEGFARVEPFDAPSFYIRKDGSGLKSQTEPPWTAAEDFSNGLAKVRVGNTFGYIDSTGLMRIGAVYNRAWNFIAGMAKVELEDQCGIINQAGEEILPFQFDQIAIRPEAQQLICHKDQRTILYPISGHPQTASIDGKIMETDGRRMILHKEGKYYLVSGVSDPVDKGEAYDHLYYLGQHRWAARKSDGYRILDEEGQPLHTIPYTQINHYQDGYAVVSRNGYWGYADLQGQEPMGHPFGLAWDFKEGFARAAFKDGIAFINRNLDLAFYPPNGTVDMRDFSEGLAPVQVAR